MGILSRVFNRENAIDVLTLLETQHKEVDALFEAIEKGDGNKRALFTELADKLAAHATVEEKIFYPAVMAKETSELLQESVEEHLAMCDWCRDYLQQIRTTSRAVAAEPLAAVVEVEVGAVAAPPLAIHPCQLGGQRRRRGRQGGR